VIILSHYIFTFKKESYHFSKIEIKFKLGFQKVEFLLCKVVNTEQEIVSAWSREQNISVLVNTGILFQSYHYYIYI
jgi:hypothetical protein